MQKIYHSEAYDGMVSATYLSDGTQVILNFKDEDISSSRTRYCFVKTESGYEIINTKDLITPVDHLFGANNPRTERTKTNAKTEREARIALVEHLLKVIPKKPTPTYSNINRAELQAGLEKALLN